MNSSFLSIREYRAEGGKSKIKNEKIFEYSCIVTAVKIPTDYAKKKLTGAQSYSENRIMKKLIILVFSCLIVLFLTSCLLFFSVSEEEIKRTVEIYNPTSEPVEITCYDFDKTEPEVSVLPANSRRTYKLASFNKSGDVITIFEEGTFFHIASEKFTITGTSTKISLSPNCSLIIIRNNFSSSLQMVDYGTQIMYNATLSAVTSSISSYGTGILICTEREYSTIRFYIGTTRYETNTMISAPRFGQKITVNINSYSIKERNGY